MQAPKASVSTDKSALDLPRLWEASYRSTDILTWLVESALQDDTISEIYDCMSRGDLNEVRVLAHRMSEDLSRICARPTVRALRKVARKPVSSAEEMRLLVDDARHHSEKLKEELERVMGTAASGGERFSAMIWTMRSGVR